VNVHPCINVLLIVVFLVVVLPGCFLPRVALPAAVLSGDKCLYTLNKKVGAQGAQGGLQGEL
jgi:hypothetical protein